MHNLVLLIGRLVNEPELVKTETGKKVLTIRLAVQRNFKKFPHFIKKRRQLSYKL